MALQSVLGVPPRVLVGNLDVTKNTTGLHPLLRGVSVIGTSVVLNHLYQIASRPNATAFPMICKNPSTQTGIRSSCVQAALLREKCVNARGVGNALGLPKACRRGGDQIGDDLVQCFERDSFSCVHRRSDRSSPGCGCGLRAPRGRPPRFSPCTRAPRAG